MRGENTEKLRRLLDARGIRHIDNSLVTTWGYWSDTHTADETVDGLLTVSRLTPEQAIAATVDYDRCEGASRLEGK